MTVDPLLTTLEVAVKGDIIKHDIFTTVHSKQPNLRILIFDFFFLKLTGKWYF